MFMLNILLCHSPHPQRSTSILEDCAGNSPYMFRTEVHVAYEQLHAQWVDL